MLFILNVDYFKRINDTLGLNVGDEVLIEVAKRVSSSLRENDLAARLNADEFALMLVNVEKEQIDAISSRIFKNLNRIYHLKNRDLVISFSVGICIYPDDGSSIDIILKQADIALQHAKENGRSRYQYYSHSLMQNISHAHQSEIELQTAIEENQLCLYYQPIYNLRTKQINSFEALIRWKHPTRGLLGAGDIIPLAERTELIHTIGLWVLETACKQVKEWQLRGLPVVPVAVNIAAAQMRHGVLKESITNTLQSTELDTKLLEIEITETGFIDLTPELLKDLESLRASGIKLTIDDFGTGYAGLGYLKKLPVGKLKIDKSFIRDIKTDPDDKAITLAIIAIAHQLDLQVTAEGVENLEQYNFLCYHQVDEVQGYFLSPPLNAENCEKLLSGEQPAADSDSDPHQQD